MIDFLKEFFAGEKKPEPRQRDIITLDAYAMDEEEEQQGGGCGSGCGGCGCG